MARTVLPEYPLTEKFRTVEIDSDVADTGAIESGGNVAP
jgi:hypothetical protein